ncbi:MAG: DoxX family protein [Bacteroidetes bacterium]|nr:DoxX family protein [Bacteroidota bacterium]
MDKKNIIKTLLFLLSSFFGLVFLYSGWTKLDPIEPFEYTFIDLGVAGWKTAPFIARFMIGLEFFIGFLLIFGLYIKRFTIRLTIATLVVFSVYLAVILIHSGNNGNCGCFGNALAMTPLQALIKNIVMLALCFVIYRFYDGFNFGRIGRWLMGLTAIAAFALPHILNYVDLDYSEAYLNKPEDQFKLELDSLYKNAKINTPPQSLRTGKHIIAFMSLTCPHCRIAAKKMKLIHDHNPNISIYFVLNGDKEKFKPFYDDTHSESIPYCQLNGRAFVYLAGVELPMIYMVNNSTVENYVNYMELDQTEIEKWLAKP